MKFYSIRAKFAFIITLLIGAISLFIFFYFPARMEKQALKSIAEQVQSITEMTAFSISPGLDFKDNEAIEEVIKGTKQSTELVYLVVIDDSSNVFSSYNKEIAYQTGYLEAKDSNHISSDGIIYRTMTSITLNNVEIGQLYVGFSLEELNAEVIESKIVIAVISVIIFFIGMVAVFGISTVITKPLTKMIKSADQITGGDLNHRTDVSSNDEVGQLAKSFNFMVDNLEKQIEERTRELHHRKIAEGALLQSEEKHKSLVNQLPVGIYRTTKNGKILHANPTLAKILEYDNVDELLQMNLREIFYNNNKRDMQIQDWKEQKNIVSEELELITKTGKKIYIRNTGKAIFDKNGEIEYFDGTLEDITERKNTEEEMKKLEEQFFQSQKMESLGRLAGGIAHDFNNILMSIMNCSEILKMESDNAGSKVERMADIIMEGAKRAANLTQQLLGFARGGKYNPLPLNINEVIRDTVMVSETIFKKNIKVCYEFDRNIQTIEADKNQFDQVFMNLIINANDAMPDGGELIFKTENSGDNVCISITDTGIGMIKEVKNRIFDPFFTTKGIEKGTGLGLATVYGIVRNHGGIINVYSEVGEGTTFTINLPISKKEIVKVEKEVEVLKGDAIILVVDDEELVRNSLKLMLKRLSYRVLLAKDGKEAVKIFKRKKDEIDLVLLDMVMPEMTGRETNIKLRSINPEVKVLISSGYSLERTATEILNEGALGFIQKPFSMQELSKAISEALNKSNV